MRASVSVRVRVRVRARAGDTPCLKAGTADTDHAAFFPLKKEEKEDSSVPGREVAKLRPGDYCGPWAASWRVAFRRLGAGVTPAGAGLPQRLSWEERSILEATEQSHREGEPSPRRRRQFLRRRAGKGGEPDEPFPARARGELPPGRLQSPRRNWCEGSVLAGQPAPARARRWPGEAGACVPKAGHLHEATRPRGGVAAATAAADPGGGARSEPGGPGGRAPVDARPASGPRAGAEAARGVWARGGVRGRGPEAAAKEEAEEGGRAEPGRGTAPRRRRRSPGLAMLLASAVVVWEWLNEHGRWRPYSPAVSHHIEAVVRAGPRAGGSVVLGQVDSRLAPYIIDLQSMNQFRQDTGEPAAPAPPARTSPPRPEISHPACTSALWGLPEVVVEGALLARDPKIPPAISPKQSVSVFWLCKPSCAPAPNNSAFTPPCKRLVDPGPSLWKL